MSEDVEANLRDNELKYIELYKDLLSRRDLDANRLAAPFISSPMEGYWESPLRVMYVGKATGGEWGYDVFSFEELAFQGGIEPTAFLDKTKSCTRKFLGWVGEGRYNPAFWRFAHKLSQEAYAIGGTTGRPLANLLWTNVAKLGVKEGNPGGQYLWSQVDLARAMLKAEVQHYRPHAIVICTGIYANGEGNSPDIVHSVFGSVDLKDWQKPVDTLWWRPSSLHEFGLKNDHTPIVVSIIDHPQGKRREVVEKWIDVIAESWRSYYSTGLAKNKKACLSIKNLNKIFQFKKRRR